MSLASHSLGLVDCSWSTSKVVNIHVTGSQIPKIGDICACSTITTGQITKGMTRGVSAYWIGLARDSHCPVDFSGSRSKVYPCCGVLNSEYLRCSCLQHYNCCSDCKQMSRWDLAHRVDTVRALQCPVDCGVNCRITAPPCGKWNGYELREMNYAIWIIRYGISDIGYPTRTGPGKGWGFPIWLKHVIYLCI